MIGKTNAIAVSGGGVELKIVVSVTSGALVTATKGPLSVQGTSVNGTATLTVPEAGTWSVSATLNEETTNTVIINVTESFPAELLFIDPILNNNSWETIRKVSDLGIASNYWSVGDRKAVVLNGSVGSSAEFNKVTAYAYIIGFDHNANKEGGDRIHFQLGFSSLSGGSNVCYVDSYYNSYTSIYTLFNINNSNTNVGGWNASRMRTDVFGQDKESLTNTLMGAIPADLRTALKSVTKYTNNVGKDKTEAAVTATTDYFFLLSEHELFGSIANANTYEGSYQEQYAYYSAGNTKVKRKHTATSETAIYWLRSAAVSGDTMFVICNTSGNVSYNGARTSLGIAPGFCV